MLQSQVRRDPLPALKTGRMPDVLDDVVCPPSVENSRLASKPVVNQVMDIEEPLFSPQEIYAARVKFGRLMTAVQEKISLPANQNLSTADKILLTYQAMGEHGLKMEDSSSPRFSTFTQNILDGKLDCDSSAMIILATAERNGWNDVGAIGVPAHMFVRHAGKNFDCGLVLPDSYYDKYPLPNGKIPGSLTRDGIMANAYAGVSYANLEQESAVDAEINAKRALALNPNNSLALDCLALTKFHAKDWAGAQEVFDRELKINPKYDRAYRNRGDCKFNQGDYQGAQADYLSAIQLDPDNASHRAELGYVKIELRDFTGAADAFQEAIKRDPLSLSYYQAFVYSKLMSAIPFMHRAYTPSS